MHNQEWAAVVNTTTEQFLSGAADMTIRERMVFAMLQNRGRLKFGQSGTELKWQVKFALPETEVYTGGVLDFQPSDKYRQASIDWRGYAVTDTMDEKERLMNRGAQALINRYSEIMPDMIESLMQRMDTELFINGVTYTDRLHGLETFLGDDGNTVVADRVAKPSTTYAGLSTVPGALAGTWSANTTTKPSAQLATDWPGGEGDSEYDYWSPRLLNWSSTGWGTGKNTWIDNCEIVLRKGNSWTRLTTGKAGKLDLWLVNEDMFDDYGTKQSLKQRINVGPSQELIELGFPNGYQQEGVSIMTEFGVPADTGYGLNVDTMELRCMYDKLYASKGPEYDMKTMSYLWSVGFFGNWKYESPKWFVKLKNYAAS